MISLKKSTFFELRVLKPECHGVLSRFFNVYSIFFTTFPYILTEFTGT